jgi:hypothetical protein
MYNQEDNLNVTLEHLDGLLILWEKDRLVKHLKGILAIL